MTHHFSPIVLPSDSDNIIMTFGQYKGFTYEHVFNNYKGFSLWVVRLAVQATLGIGEGCSESLAHYARYLFFKHSKIIDFKRFISDGPVAWVRPPTTSAS